MDSVPKVSGSAMRYVVLFLSEQTTADPPVVPLEQIAHANSLYGLAPEVVPVLPALKYVLNLPRNALDLSRRPLRLVRDFKQLDLPHDVFFAPWPVVCQWQPRLLRGATLVVHPESISPQVVAEACPDTLLGVVSQNRLNEQLCRAHWARLEELYGATDPPRYPHRPELESCARLVLSHTARLFSLPEVPVFNEPAEQQLQLLRLHHHVTALAHLEAQLVPAEEVEDRMDEALEATASSFSVPVAIVAPGIPAPLRRALIERGARPDLSPDGTVAECEAMEILGAHRAIARGGAYVVLPTVPVGIFRQLFNLEREYEQKQRRAQRVLDLLGKIGRLLAAFLEEHLYSGMIAKSSDVLVMSQFPLGLATPRGSKSPLSMWKPLFYRPLIPLTRMLQMELPDHATYYLEAIRLKLLIVECLEEKDLLYHDSMRAWTRMQTYMKDDYEIEFVCASSIGELSSHIERVTPHILIVSGHGTTGPARNQRSVAIGEERYTGIEIPHVPPLVFLSVCSTSPRGGGDVSVADMMLRHGAYAVVCCMVPVDFAHNAQFFMRLLIYMAQARACDSPLRNFADVWHYTIMTHPVFDILHSLSRTPEGQRLELEAYRARFMTAPPTTMRRTHAHQDALLRLEEVADELGERKRFSEAIRLNGFLPESLFYMVLGWPEKFVLNSPLYRKVIEARKGGELQQTTPS